MKRAATSILAILAIIAVLGIIAALLIPQVVKPPAPKVDCYTLWKPYQLYGVTVNHTLTIKDAMDKEPVAGINVYEFEDKPYYWANLSYSQVAAILTGKTPVATSGADGRVLIPFTTPESKTERKTLYLVFAGPDYWTEEYEMTVAFTPEATAPSYEDCRNIYKSPYDFLKIQMKNAVTGEPVGYVLLMKPIGTVSTLAGTLGVPTDANQTFYEMTATEQFVVSRGYYRIDAIKIRPTGVFDPKNGVFEGIHRIEVEVLKGTQKIAGPVVIFDESIEDTPLRKDGYWNLGKFLGKEYLELAPDEAITVKVKVVADTETTASAGDGRLGPGEAILTIELVPTHPLSTGPSITVTG